MVLQRSEVAQRVGTIFADETGLELKEFAEETRLQDDLNLNSIDFIAPLMKIESKYEVRFQQTDFAGVKTFGDVVNLVMAKLTAKEATTAAAHSPPHSGS